MGNHLKGCGCRRCRAGMHTRGGGFMLQRVIRKIRRIGKMMLRRGQEPPPTHSLEYTD